jgi:hypothetical protein
MWSIGNQSKDRYKEVIQTFLKDEGAFKSFKQNRFYSSIIGSPSIPQAIGFLSSCIQLPIIKDNLEKLKKADDIGNPVKYTFGTHTLSLNLIRSFDSLRLLQKEFGSLNGYSIIEVGVGYGLLCHSIQAVWNIQRYCIYDLEPAMDLCLKHSSLLNINNVYKEDLKEPDLCICEYSITEQSEDELFRLTSKYVLTSKNAFIRCNIENQSLKEKWLELLKKRFEVKVYEEEPSMLSVNCIVICKFKSDYIQSP